MNAARAFLIAHEQRLRRVALAIGFIILAWQFIAAFRPRGDFLLHWEFGRRFLLHAPLYANGMHVPYPPFWAMAHAPLALLPVWVAKPAFYLIGAGSVLLMMWLLAALAPVKSRLFWMHALTLLLASRFIMRDLADGGQNLVLTALVWTAIWLWTQKRIVPASLALGIAVALKCTALIFVGWFVWKRQWRMAFISLAAALAFSLAPALWMGPGDYSRHISEWGQTILTGISQADPGIGVLGPEPFQNDSLRPTLARFLMHLPQGHPGRYESPWYSDFLNLTPRAAGIVIKIVTLLLGLTLLWRLRGKLTAQSAVWQFSALGVFMLLLSPITWGQHCVAAWPALWLLTRELVENGRWKKCTLLFAILTLLTNREFLGKPLSYLLASYHVTTLALLVLLAIMLIDARRARHFPQEQEQDKA